MLRTLQGWISNGFDALALMWTEPLSWLVLGAGVCWVAAATLRRARFDPWRPVAALALVVWSIAVLAMTVYPLEYLRAPTTEVLDVENFIPLAGTIDAISKSGGWTMTPDELLAQRERIAADLGIPLDEVILDPRVSGPGTAVLRDPVGNVVMFVPLGLLAPFVWPAMRRARNVVVAGIGVSISIELSQALFGLGSLGTIDDVIFNAMGAALGFALLASARRLQGAAGRRVSPAGLTRRPLLR